MRALEVLGEDASSLDQALSQGWVRIRYTRKDGMSRLLMATTNPDLYTYTRKRATPLQRRHGIMLVWDRLAGWRALYRHRINGWKLAQAAPG